MVTGLMTISCVSLVQLCSWEYSDRVAAGSALSPLLTALFAIILYRVRVMP